MQFLRGFITSASRFLGRSEVAEMDKGQLVSDASNPFIVSFVPANPNVPTFVSWVEFFSIPAILRSVGLSQVLSPIVECVVVFVVKFFIRITLENFFFHVYRSGTYGVKALSSNIPLSVPIEIVDSLKIFNVHDSDLVLREGDKAIRLIKRLDNRRSWHSPECAFLGHRSSVKGSLLPAAILAQWSFEDIFE